MPNTLTPNVLFNGLPGLQSFEMTLSTGRAPAIGRFVVHADLANLQTVSDIVISDGEHEPIRLPRCRVQALAASGDTNNASVTLFVYDRRWEWEHGVIHGRYNVPMPSVFNVSKVPDFGQPPPPAPIPEAQLHPEQYEPQVQANTKKSARELGVLLVKAMREKHYNLAALPSDQYPEVNWDAANPAAELERLAEQYGGRLVYCPQWDGVLIARLGEGAGLPANESVASENLTIDPPELPTTIAVYGAAAEYQGRLQLEAVLPDFDQVWKPIEKVSYRPTDGWGAFGPPFRAMDATDIYGTLPGEYTARDAAALIQKWLYKAYRIKETLPKPSKAAGSSTVTTTPPAAEFRIPFNSKSPESVRPRDHVFISGVTCETNVDALGQRNVLPARVYGSAVDAGPIPGISKAGEAVRFPFTVDPQQGLVIFSSEVYTQTAADGTPPTATFAAADLVLECACTVAHPADHQIERYRLAFGNPPKSSGTSAFPGEHAVIREDVRYCEIAVYKSTSEHKITKIVRNDKEAAKKAEHYFRGELLRYETQTPQDVTFNGLVPVYCDGAILQVTWLLTAGEGGGCFTRASRNSEHSTNVPPYPERRRQAENSAENARRSAASIAESKKLQQRFRTGTNFDPFSVT